MRLLTIEPAIYNRVNAGESFVDWLPVHLDLLLNITILPNGPDEVAIQGVELALSVSLTVFELAVVELSADHRGALAFRAVVLPFTVVVVLVLRLVFPLLYRFPVVLALAVLLAVLKGALVAIAVVVDHKALAVVLAVQEVPLVGAVVLLDVLAVAIELVVGPVADVVVAVGVLDLALAVLLSVFPKSLELVDVDHVLTA